MESQDDDFTPFEDLHWTPLHWATYRGHFLICKMLIDNGADVQIADECKRTPLHWACCRGHLEIVKLLIENGADSECTEEDHWTPLHWACYAGHYPIIVYLLEEKSANLEAEDITKETPIFMAVILSEREDGLRILEYLIKKKAKVNVGNKFNWTPMHYAALNGLLDNVKILIESGGAKWNEKNHMGETPKDLARKHSEVVEYLNSLEKSHL